MKIHIVGASCAGSTTLGKALSLELNIPYFDTDSFFWAESDIPYTIKRDPEQRNQMLKDQLLPHESFIVGGSLVSWGEEWKTQFDLVVFSMFRPRFGYKDWLTENWKDTGMRSMTIQNETCCSANLWPGHPDMTIGNLAEETLKFMKRGSGR
ncbi:P-loop NTPase family protein [Pedobacter duraquae]|uniref:Adenylate kinase family enzyme n=1 Tax=Pedobacter duraquae TaxID=425511 RepID=A0A4R6IAS1_9SPHI|nr:hypothetical protein [Pedobacter duraquae]TDO19313.1 hypothetical protein CLV32_4553 [Pedobacter duraquae]